MPRVLILRSSLYYGGIERQILDHARRLLAEGWGVDLVCCLRGEGEHPLASAAREQGVQAVTLCDPGPAHPHVWRQLRTWWALANQQGEPPDIVHSCDYRSDVLGWWLARRVASGAPAWVAESHGHTWEGRAMRLWNACDRLALRRADAVVCVSHAWETSLAAAGVAAERLHVMGNTTAILAGDPLPTPSPLPDGRHILFAGRLSPEKGIDWLLASWSEVRERFHDLHLWVAGPAMARRDVQAGLQQTQVHWLGFQSDIRPWMLAVDAVVTPSRQEAWGMTVFEALALGIPVVAAGVGGLPQLCKGAPHALTVTPGSISAMIAGLDAVLAPGFPRGPDLGLAYRSQPRFDPALRMQGWLALYSRLLDPRRA